MAGTKVDIPVDKIRHIYGDIANRIVEELAIMGEEKIMENTLRFGTRENVQVNKKLRTSIRRKASEYAIHSYIVGAFAPHAHLLEDGHVKVLWGRFTGEFVPGYHFVADAESEVISKINEVAKRIASETTVFVRR